MRTTSFFAMAAVLAASAVGALPPVRAAAAGAMSATRTAHVLVVPRPTLAIASALSRADAPVEAQISAGWARSLAPIEVSNRNTGAHASIRLYTDDGSLDPDAARAFMEVAAAKDARERDVALDLRLVQLAVRASYHFGGAPIEVVSATRRRARGRHAKGEALDFALEGVRAASLAAYLRTFPRAGVGIYTHPRTQFAHLDVRDRSYHWIDASPPGVSWRERRLGDPKQEDRDAAYAPSMDLPERATAPAGAQAIP